MPHLGFLRTIITESPRRNILLMNRSLLTGRAFFFPFPVFGTWAETQSINEVLAWYWKKEMEKIKELFIWCRTNLCPHLSNIFQYHVAVAIKCSHAAQKLFVVPAVDKHLFGAKKSNICHQQSKTLQIQLWNISTLLKVRGFHNKCLEKWNLQR